jgi:coenzyme F420-0:L-glutamate ligase / coenzyme F420-1:gamma-L-glutamate ligase
MSRSSLQIIPIQAPVQDHAFDLEPTLFSALDRADCPLQAGDVVAISSKYVAISEDRIVNLADVPVGDEARALAERYNMDATIAQLVLDDADHIFGGIPLGFLLTWRSGIIAPNAGLDRSNIPQGQAVLLPQAPYDSAYHIRQMIKARTGLSVGVILTDSWLVPGRLGTTGVALASAGFVPVQDERGKADLFGNPMAVTQKGVADSLSVCAQMVMGERDEATPIAVIRGAEIELSDARPTQADVAIDWEMCIYVESLTLGLLPDGAPRESLTAQWAQSDPSARP